VSLRSIDPQLLVEQVFAQITQLPQSGGPSVTTFALQVVALITGGGIVQLIVFLLRRRSEITALDKTASAPLLTSANELIVRLEASEARAGLRVDELTSRLASEQRSSIELLRVANDENLRLGSEIAKLRVDLGISQRQIKELEFQFDRYRQGQTGLR
jgi:hypothetical protein